jgi:hypothetical protein
MSWRGVGVAVALLVLSASLVLGGPVLWLQVDEGAIPPSSDVPSLPAGVSINSGEVLCGSGGCYRRLTLSGPAGQSPEELAASIGLPHQVCHARSLLDRRRVCSHLDVAPEDVFLVVQFDR